jgi:hypothetical protein
MPVAPDAIGSLGGDTRDPPGRGTRSEDQMPPIIMLAASFAALIIASRTLEYAARMLGLPPDVVSLLETIALR